MRDNLAVFLPAVVAFLAFGAAPHVAEGTVTLADGRRPPVLIDTRDLGGPAVRIVPRLGASNYGDFGESFVGAIAFECRSVKGRVPPTLEDVGTLACPTGAAPTVRPNVTLPDRPEDAPTSAVPAVRPGSRPVVASLDLFRAWFVPIGVSSVLCLILGVLAFRRVRRQVTASTEPDPPRWARADSLIATGLVGLGSALRFTNLGFESLEQNEFTYFMSAFGHDRLMDVVLDVNAMAQTHPPLPHVLSWLLSSLGNDETLARLPSAIAGVLTLPLLYRLGLHLAGRAVATTAALLAALSPVHAWYSQDASPYTLVTLFSVLLLIGADSVLRAARWPAFVALVGGAVGLFYTHYYGVHLILVVFGVLLFTAWRRADRVLAFRTFGAGLISAAALLPWLPAFVQAYAWADGHSTAYQRMAGVYHPNSAFFHDLLDALRLTAGLSEWTRHLTLVGCALFGLWLVRGALPRGRRALLLAPLIWFVPFEILNRETFLNTLYGGYYFGIRYFLFLFPLAWLVAGACVAAALARRTHWASIATLLLLVITLVDSGRETVSALIREDKPDVRSAAHLVTRLQADGDAILVGPAVFYQHPWHYYAAAESARFRLRINDFMRTPDWQSDGTLGVLTDLVEPWPRSLASLFIRRVWVVDHHQHLFGRREFSDRPEATIDAAVTADFTEIWRRDLHDVRVRLFERRRTSVPPPAVLAFGWNDAAYVRGVHPPPAWANPGRRVRRIAELVLPKAHRTRLRLRAGATPVGPVAVTEGEAVTPVTVSVSANGVELGAISVTDRFDAADLILPVPLRDVELRLRIEPMPTPAGLPVSSVILDRLELMGE